MNITLTGDLGSGKSAVSKILINQGYNYVTVGQLFRQEAQRRGISVEELNKLAETDATIDKVVDDMQIEYGRKLDKTVFDSRLSFHFVPNSYKVYLMVNLNEAASRIYADSSRVSEKHTNIDSTKQDILYRRKLELARYKKKYGVDYSDYNNYNLVVDTTCLTPVSVGNLVRTSMNLGIQACFLCCENVFPTQPMRCMNAERLGYYRQQLRNNVSLDPINVIQTADTTLYVIDGHHRLLASLIEGTPLIRASISKGEAHDTVPCSVYYDYEEMGKFKYKYYPNK